MTVLRAEPGKGDTLLTILSSFFAVGKKKLRTPAGVQSGYIRILRSYWGCTWWLSFQWHLLHRDP